MTKYSKEQRDRAVDLYIRYERCAADVIRELGYPSRGMLPVWYRERLEEERAGVLSMRGERCRRYSDEQKRAAVDHYLEYGRRLRRAMRALGYPKSHELLTAWIDELAPGRRKLRHGPVPEELKRKAVVAVASGRLKSREAAAELGVEASVVGKPETADARRIQGDARDEDTWREAPDGRGGENRRGALYAGGPRDAAGLADAVAALEKRLAETRARLDELDADVERQRREKRELDIEIAIRKGALELLGKEPGAVPENPANREKAILVKQTSEKLGVTARSLLPVVGIARSTYHYQLKSMKRPDKDAPLPELVREALREQQAQVRVQADPPEAEGHGNRGQREADHEAHDQARPSAPVQEREAVQLVQGRADQGAEEPGEPRLPRRGAEPAVGHGPDRVLDSRGQGLPVAGHRLLRRASRRVDDRHEPERGVGQRHAAGRVLHAQGRREADHPQRPRLPLPVARMDPHLQGQQPDAFDERERLFSGQRGRGGVLRPSQAGVLPQAQLRGRLDGRVHQHAQRLHGLVPGQADQDGVRHEHHGSSTRARSCGMIGGDGINDESNKMSPAPNRQSHR